MNVHETEPTFEVSPLTVNLTGIKTLGHLPGQRRNEDNDSVSIANAQLGMTLKGRLNHNKQSCTEHQLNLASMSPASE